MKSVTKLFLLGIVVFFGSCQNEPVDYSPPVVPVKPPVNVVGKYDLIAYNTSVKTDLNQDGVLSANQMDEADCYSGNTLEVKDDNTFVLTDKGVNIVTDENMVDLTNCYTKPNIVGTWKESGNVLTLMYTINNTKFTKNFIISGETIVTCSETNVKVVTKNTLHKPVYVTANVSKIYAMQ
jgi:hypothetical protein